MRDLILFPFNGNAIEAIDCIDNSEYRVIGFVDDSEQKIGSIYNGLEVFSREALLKYQNAQVLAVPGSPSSFLQRKKIISSLQVNVERFATIIHPRAYVSQYAKIGHNCLIMAGVVVTSNAKIANHICILPNSTIHHDVEVNDYSLIGANVNISSHVLIDQQCYIGSGSAIKDGINISQNVMIGLASCVVKDVKENSIVYGNPAKSMMETYQ